MVYIFVNSVLLLRSNSLTARLGEQLIKNIVYLVPIFIQCGHIRVPAEFIKEEDEDGKVTSVEDKGVLQWMFERLWSMSLRKGNVKVHISNDKKLNVSFLTLCFPLQISCLFNLIGALTTKLRSKNLKPYLLYIARIIFRYEENRNYLDYYFYCFNVLTNNF